MSRERMTLLLADDDHTIVDSLAPFLERAGFKVLVVSNGAAALEKVQSHHPDLIVLDVLMPRMDGRETLRRLRHANVWTPTILLTQVGEASERALALEEARTIISTNHLTRMSFLRAFAPSCGVPALASVLFPQRGCSPQMISCLIAAPGALP